MLAVLGGTGRTGRKVVEIALERGHSVKVLSRTDEAVTASDPRRLIVKGDALDPRAVDAAVIGADAVLSTLGHTKDSPRDLEARALTNVVDSMRRSSVRRLVVLSSSAVLDPSDSPTTSQALVRILLKTFRGAVYSDSVAKALVVRHSGLDWTIVRASLLSDSNAGSPCRTGSMSRGMGVRVSRTSLAAFIVDCATEGKFVGSAPYVSD